MAIPATIPELPVECPICYEDITAGGRGDEAAVRGVAVGWSARVIANCTHLFHEKCLRPWLEDGRHDPTCPVCRAGPFTHIHRLHDGSKELIEPRWDRFSPDQYRDDEYYVEMDGGELAMCLFATSWVVSTFVLNFIYVDFGLAIFAGLATGVVFTAIFIGCTDGCAEGEYEPEY